MITFIKDKRPTFGYRILSGFIAFTFIFGIVIPPQVTYAQLIPSTVLNLPLPGTLVPVSVGYTPALMTGLTVYPENPLEFDFMIDTGDAKLAGSRLEDESKKLIKYFLASLTVPEDQLWVNLSPYEKDRIIPQSFGETEMGRDLLAQDYLLKQLTASLMYPENELGKKFWDRVYKKANDLYGTTEIPMNTFNKIWIVPDQALVFEKDSSAYVIDSHLKVMLEEDYVALRSNLENTKFSMDQVLEEDAEVISGITSEVVREVLIPEIEREVNEGETFANLRQIYNSMILATWYKQNLKESLLGQVYVDQNKTKGVDVEDKQIKEKIYGQYLDAFKKGVYNYIKEDYDPVSQNVIPRKYFSGGFGGEIGKALSEFNIDDISSLRGNREHLVSFLIKVGELTQDEFQDVLSEINMFSSKDQKYIFSQIKNSSLLTDSKIHIAKAILVENAEDGSDGITVVKPVGKASSPVELVEGTQMVKITNKSIEPLTWGTAGARKLIGPDGFNNDNVNRQTAGFAEEILERIAAEKYLQSLSAEKERLERIRTLTYKSINGKNVRVVFAYDSRETSDDFAREMTGVLAAYKGFEVVLIDEALPTPVVARLTQRHRKDAFDFGFHVTASHNQLGWNGLKLLYDGGVNEDTWTKYAEKRANARMAYPAIPDYQPKLEKVSDDILREYLEEIFPGLIEKFAAYKTAHPTTQFTMDLMNGSMATFAQYFERLGFNVIRTKPMKEIDFSGSTYELAGGKKVGFAPDPTQKAFYEDQAEYQDFKTNAPDGSVYALIDGDGDRLVILIKQDGQIVSMTPNQFGPLATDYILTNNLIPELKRIVRTFVTTAGMDAVAKYHDLEAPVIVPVGSKYFNPFKDAAALEESGHFVFPGHFDDTMYQLGLTLTMLVETEKDLFTLLDETQQKIGYKGVDNRDDYENASDELFAKFLVPITGTPEEIRDKSKKIVNEIVRRSGKELLEALVVVVRGDGLAGKVVDIQEYVDSLFTDNPLKIEQSNRGLIVRFTDLSWGGARLSGTANTGRLYTEGRESSEERQQIADAFIDTLGLNDTASSPVQLASRPEGNWETWEMSTLDLTELNVDMFHAYDYLNVGPKVNPLVVWNLGLDWAQSALAKARAAGITNRTVLMAKDARKIEPELEDALVAALRYSGLDVKYIAADGPNAMTSYSGAMQLLKPLMGIFETASHLSTDETIVCGWKVAQMKEIGGAPKSLTTKEVRVDSKANVIDLIRNPEKARELEAEHKGSVEHINIDEDVIRLNVLFGKVAGSRGSLYELGEELNDAPTSEAAYAVLEKWERKYQDVNEPLKGVRIAIDGVHTGTGPIAAEVFKRLGAEVHARNLDIRLVTGRHNANLSIDENLANVRETIKSVNADFGMAFDLGGDRGLIVTPDPSTANGFYEIESDEAQVVLLQELKEKWGYDNIPTGFIRDVLGTYALNLIAKKMDVRFDQTDAGYPFLKVRKEVRENEAKAKGERIVFPVFGERSGRIWLHFTGEIENPLAVEILFAAMVRHGKKDLIEQGLAGNDFDAPTAIKIFNEKRIPFTKSKRVQPLFHLDFLKDLESNPENKEIGWTFNGEVGKFKNPPSALIKVGNDIVVKKLKEFFTPGKEFNTPVGVLTVSEFNTERDDGAIGGRHQFADIIFEQNGGVVGRIVFRTSSKDSTFASTYEAPGEGRELHRNSAMGIVFDFLKDNNIALVTTDMLDLLPLTDEQKKDVIAKFNLKFLEEDYISYQRAAGREVAPLLVNQYEIDTGNAYWNGDLTTTPITRPFRASREEDVKDMVTLREQEALLYERLALESLLKGEGYISVLIAGASGRMNTAKAPKEVKDMVGEKEIKSKAAVPVGEVDGRVITYFDAFGISVARLLKEIEREAKKGGRESKVMQNDIGFLTNDYYRPEHDEMLVENSFYGLSPELFRFYRQPVGAKFVGTPEEVEKLKIQGKFNTEEDYLEALEYSKTIAERRKTDPSAVILKGEADPLGHGEFFHQMILSGELLHMYDTGKKWVFTRNIDNYAAKFDKKWLQILGAFLFEHLDFQGEVCPRVPGLKGGNLIVMTDTGGHQFAETPNIDETNKIRKKKGEPLIKDSYWFNNAVGLMTIRYIISLYKKERQTDEGFIQELRYSSDSDLAKIANRGRKKFPKILDPKPAKTIKAATVKAETNLWQSTNIIDDKVMEVRGIGVRSGRNFPVNDYLNGAFSPKQKQKQLANLRFLATKQWEVTSKKKEELRNEINRAMINAGIDRMITDEELALTLESYKGNELVANDILRYILKAKVVTNGILSNEALSRLVLERNIFNENKKDTKTTSSPITKQLATITAQLKDFALTKDQVRDILEVFVDGLTGDDDIIGAERTVISALTDTSQMLSRLIDDPDPDMTNDDIQQLTLKRAALKENILIFVENITQKIKNEESTDSTPASSPVSIKDRVALIEYKMLNGWISNLEVQKYLNDFFDSLLSDPDTISSDMMNLTGQLRGVSNRMEETSKRLRNFSDLDFLSYYSKELDIRKEYLDDNLRDLNNAIKSMVQKEKSELTDEIMANIRKHLIEKYSSTTFRVNDVNQISESLGHSIGLIRTALNKMPEVTYNSDEEVYVFKKTDGTPASLLVVDVKDLADGRRLISEFDSVKNKTVHTMRATDSSKDWSFSEKGDTHQDDSRAIIFRSGIERMTSYVTTLGLRDGDKLVSFFDSKDRTTTHEYIGLVKNWIFTEDGNTVSESDGYYGINKRREAQISSPLPVGGIDLNPELLDLQIKRDGSGIPLPLHQQPIYNMKIEGFLPVIINITPVVNTTPLLLGLIDGEADSDDLSFVPALEPMQKIGRFTLKDRVEAGIFS